MIILGSILSVGVRNEHLRSKSCFDIDTTDILNWLLPLWTLAFNLIGTAVTSRCDYYLLHPCIEHKDAYIIGHELHTRAIIWVVFAFIEKRQSSTLADCRLIS